MNKLYYGDNLHVLRDRKNFPDECVDLIYLDPPFNSKRDYNLLFKSPKVVAGGEGAFSAAQIEAFEDTWHWSPDVTEREYDEVLRGTNTDVSEMMKALVAFLGRNDMTAYLVMMANRLVELHRVLKPTGSLYLHCDPTASHYLKIVLDAVFRAENYRNELVWKRSNPKSLGSINFPTCSDTIFRYCKTGVCVFHQPYGEHDPEYVESAYRYSDKVGRYRLLPLLNPNDNRPNLTYEFLGVTRVWRWTRARMEKALADGLIVQAKPGAVPQYKKYLEDSKGRTVTNVWTDIEQVAGNEALGYPTQKPLALLERIVSASSNAGDVVLDPFCGCGTAVDAAHKLGRKWLGIDITCLAITLIESRLKQRYPEAFGTVGQQRLQYEVIGTPKDLESARDLARRDKYQFQWWAVSLIDEAQPWQGKKKGADTGIDGVRYFRDLDRKEVHTMLISVKGGDNVGPAMVKDLIATLARDGADIGLFITLAAPTRAMTTEAAAAGFYTSPNGRKYPRLQLLTIEGLLDRTQRAEHPDYEPDTGFKKAKAEHSGEQTTLL